MLYLLLADYAVAMIKRILHATDLGLYSPYLMKKLAQLALSTGARVSIIHVIEPMGVFAESVLNSYIEPDERRYLQQYGFDKLFNAIKAQVMNTFESEYQDILKGVVLEQMLVEQGVPSQVIVESCLEVGADVLVIGSHGQYSLDNSVLGSVASKILQRSPIPVLVIPMLDIEGLDRQT